MWLKYFLILQKSIYILDGKSFCLSLLNFCIYKKEEL